MTLWRVSVRVEPAGAEPLRARMLALVPEGFEEREVSGTLELAAYVSERRRDAILEQLPGAAAELVADGWEDAWRAFHRPVRAGGLWIGPPWESPPDSARAVLIEPGRAFGTGAHPTTRLCIELLGAMPVRGSLLDVGCGSGVLAIAGSRLGFVPVAAIDVDPVAVETTRANAGANGAVLDAFVLDAVREPLPRADVAVANVLLEPVEEILGRLDAERAVTSGYLSTDAPRAPDWNHVDRRELGGWAADAWVRPAAQNRMRESTV